MKNKLSKSIVSALICSSMLINAFPAYAEETASLTANSMETISFTDDSTSDELLLGYFEKQLMGGSDIGTFAIANSANLSDGNKIIYDTVKSAIKEIADGKRASTTVEIPFTWTFEEMGFGTTYDGLQEAYDAKTEEYDGWTVVKYLLADCPYELYWYNKTAGTPHGFSNPTVDSTNRTVSDVYQIQFTPDVNYKGASDYTVDTAKTSAASTAAANAVGIVNDASVKADFDKLAYYKEKLCELNSYNYNAASNDYVISASGIDPWQIIYMFDNDTETNVVCEGYSKSFQYLCDMTVFDSDIYCYSVTGDMTDGASGGGHMWNIVTIGDNNYLVDVTNCDSGDTENDYLFFKGVTGSVENGYTAKFGSKNVLYTYDSDQTTLFGKELLTLSESDYDPDNETISISGNITWNDNNDSAGKRPTVLKCNLLLNGEIYDNVVVSAAENWAYSFTELPKYTDGSENVYTVEIPEVAEYDCEVNGNNFTFTYTIETVDISGTVTWNGDNHPDSVKVTLSDGKTVTVTAADNWVYSFNGVPKCDANGTVIKYTVTAEGVPFYKTPVITNYNIVYNTADLTVSGTNLVYGTDYTYENSVITVLGSKTITVSGTTTTDRIYVENGVSADVVLSGASIKLAAGSAFKIADDSNGNVKVTLVGTNVLASGNNGAGLEKNGEVGTLLIKGNGSLEATGGIYASGIGSGNRGSGNGYVASGITIESGTIAAKTSGVGRGAGIGGGCYGNAYNITIKGGSITATGSGGGAGIGGGFGATAENIIITGGSVKASGSSPFSCQPTSADKITPVYLLTIANAENEAVKIDGEVYAPSIHSETDKNIYAYLPAREEGDSFVVTVGSAERKYCFSSEASSWKPAANITASDMTVTYGDTGVNVNASTDSTGAVSYSVSDESVLSVDVNGNITAKKAGSAKITISVVGTDAYYKNEKEITVTVNKKEINAVSAVISDKTYDGTKAAIINSVNFDGLVNSDTLVLGIDYTATAEFEASDAGENKTVSVIITLLNSNYILAENTITVTGTIHKATPEQPETPVVSAVEFGTKLSEIDIGDWEWVNGEEIPVVNNDGYLAYLEVDDENYEYDSNYGYNTETGRIERMIIVTVTKKKIAVPKADETEFYYDGKEKTYYIAESEYYTVSDNVKTDAGEYKVIVELNDPDNYEWENELPEYIFIIKEVEIPKNVKAVAGEGKITITWDSVDEATKYRVQRLNGTTWSSINYPTATSYVDTNVTAGTTYKYRVLAYVNGVWSSYSDAVSATPTASTTPQNVKAVAGEGKVTITWSAVTGATKYRVQRTTGTSWSSINYPTATSYVDTSVTAGTTYKYRVLAYVNNSWSTASSVVSATPVASTIPQNVKAVAGDGKVTISWSAVNGATKYRVQRLNGTSWSTVNYPTATSYVDTNVTAGTTYKYRVLAYVNNVWSDYSASVSATPTASTTPQNVKAVAGDGKITISWSSVSGATKYRVQRLNGASWSTVNYPTATSYTDTGLTNGTTYKYRVLAYVNNAWSTASSVVSATPTASTTPQNVKATAGDGKITISWSAVSGATKYRVQRLNGTTWSTINYPTATSYTDTGLTNGTTYKYRVLAYVNNVWSAYSASVSATPTASTTPQNVKAVAGDGKITISWSAVSGATKYRVQRLNGTSWSTVNYPTATSYTDTGLTNGTTYKYRVLAYVNGAWSTASVVVTAIPN